MLASTNAEDLEGFNGAGLYLSQSITLENLCEGPSLAETIKTIWASVWNMQGFLERLYFQMNQQDVRMVKLVHFVVYLLQAILVQPLFEDVHCNGVAISANPFRSDFNGIFVNAQPPGYSVTDGTKGIPEQILI